MIRVLASLALASVALLNAQEFSTTHAGVVITPPRSSSATTALLFAFVSGQAGNDTEITLSNTSQDPFGSTPGSGTCTLYYYGSNPPAGPQTTAAIAAGQQIVFDVSTGGSGVAAAPGFQGYIAANCEFPLALGFAKVFALVGFGPETSQDAQVLTLPRSAASPQSLLFPYLTNQNGMDSGIVLTNSSQDPFGTSPAAGTCTLHFYGTSAPAPLTTPSIPGGQQYITTVSAVAPGFQGYAIATCGFPDAVGTGFVQQAAVPHNTWAANPEVLTLPRAGGASPTLIFPFASNGNGSDGLIAIANTSMDPVGTTPGSGTCSLALYGNSAPASAFITPTIAAGTVYTTDVSAIAPGFQGFIFLNCMFPQARALELAEKASPVFAYGTVTAQALLTPNSSPPTDLLFPALSSTNGNDTELLIANGSPASFPAGTCTISYYGTVSGGSVPGPQTTTAVSSLSVLGIDLAQGGGGVEGVPGFAGYVAVSCNFQARGVAAVIEDGPNLAITSTHTGNFIQGQQGATYTLTVGNANNAQATSGTTTVTESLPAGLTLVSMAGTGWTCPSGQNTCTRNDSLAAGFSSTITVTVNVSATASSPLVNSVSVSTGNEGAVTGTDSTTIVQGPAITGVVSGATGTTVLSPGLHATAFGSNLGNSTNLPTVMVGNLPGYVFFNGPGDVSFEIPTNAPLGPTTVTVTVSGVISNVFPINLGLYSPGLQALGGLPTGLAACKRQNGSAVSLINTPNPGESITCGGVGWGPTNPVVGTGQNSPSNPPAVTTTTPTVTVGGLPAVVSFSGLEPSFIAIYDVTFTVPAVAPGYQPFTLSIGGLTSNTVTLPVGSVVGSIIEFPVPTANSGLRGITSGPDGNLWFTEAMANNLGRITPVGAFNEYGAPSANASPEEIIAGPDGDLWFTEYAAAAGATAKVGRISTAGAFGGEFPVPTNNSEPFGIAHGPNHIWFTEFAAGKLGKMNAIPAAGTVGAAIEFAIPTSGSNPTRIALGPDGGYWFTEQAANKIGHSTSTGSITEYPIPTAGSAPWGIVAGPDGNMWFTESATAASKIGRITPSGTITEFPVLTSGAGPVGITAGPDGALWFTERFGNQIGRITTSGTVTNEFPIPTASSQPDDIVTGPDGGMWFTEAGGNNIGRLATNFTSVPVLSVTPTASASFTQGQVGATYTLTVSNAAGAGPTSGTVTVEEALPSAMGLISMAGTGWTCSGIACTTSNVLAGGASYPAITVTVDVAGDASTSGSYVNSVQVFGGGSAISTGTDSVTINPQATDGISEYPVPTTSNLLGITAGPDGAMWFCEDAAGKVGRTTIAGAISEYPIPTSTGGCGIITAGPDGNLWFTEDLGGKIGKLTVAGAFTEYALSNSSSTPLGLAAGPDGALWFTEVTNNKIGGITTTGAISEFTVPTSGSSPFSIAPGPDGALWFTERDGNKIGRVTATGTFAEYPVPTPSSMLTAIAAGPDGAMWFTEKAGKIGRITLAGSITEYPIPSGREAVQIVVGPDNALWFTENDGPAIGRITTGGSISEYPGPLVGGSFPTGIAAGPDGGMWFTEELNKIGRISTGLDATPVLGIQSTHSGNFTLGQTGATYNLTVSNSGGLSSGPIGVMENLPAGIALVSMAGSGWTCSGNNCTTTSNVANGGSLPSITVTVNVAGNAATPLINVVTVYGGGSILAFASDSTIVIGGSSCTYSLSPPPPMAAVTNSAGSGTVTVNTQSGCAWTASSDSPWLTVSSGSSGTGTGAVNYSVAANTGTAQRTGTLTIAGIAFPVTQLPPPLLTITSSHTGNFFQGETGATYAIVVSDTAGTSPPSGPVTVNENLPSSLTLVSMSGSGWTCAANLCTTAGALLPGASYPAITVTVNVLAGATSPQVNSVMVSGGGSASASGTDSTIITAPCTITLNPTSTSLPGTGTSTVEVCPNSSGQPACGVYPEIPQSFTVTPSAACGPWTATSSSPGFLQILSGGSGTGTGIVTFDQLTNTHNGQQSNTITVASSNGSATYTVALGGNADNQTYREIYALYEQFLGRDPDAGGFAFWSGVGGAGLGQMADSFLTSPEYFNSGFAVMAAYQAATGSGPTYAQYTSAVASIRAGTQTVPGLFNALIGSSFTSTTLYQNLLNRAVGAADSGCISSGLEQCFQTIIGYPANTTPVSAANNEFQSTGIYQTTLAADHTNALYVQMIYFVTVDRDPDPGGFSFWVGIANQGGPGLLFQGSAGYFYRDQILGPGTPNQGFIGSPEFQGLFAN